MGGNVLTMQTKRQSFIEASLNIVIGYIVAIVGQIVVFPWFDIDVTLGDQLGIGAIFTVISLARSYCLRRIFNRLHT